MAKAREVMVGAPYQRVADAKPFALNKVATIDNEQEHFFSDTGVSAQRRDTVSLVALLLLQSC